jgi:hypothetical protein
MGPEAVQAYRDIDVQMLHSVSVVQGLYNCAVVQE